MRNSFIKINWTYLVYKLIGSLRGSFPTQVGCHVYHPRVTALATPAPNLSFIYLRPFSFDRHLITSLIILRVQICLTNFSRASLVIDCYCIIFSFTLQFRITLFNKNIFCWELLSLENWLHIGLSNNQPVWKLLFLWLGKIAFKHQRGLRNWTPFSCKYNETLFSFALADVL